MFLEYLDRLLEVSYKKCVHCFYFRYLQKQNAETDDIS